MAEIISIDQTIDHNFNSALIVIYSQLSASNVFWGINNFQIYIFDCPLGCVVCSAGDRRTQQCISWSLGYKSLTEITSINFDNSGWLVTNQKQGNSECSNIPVLCTRGGYNNYCFTDTQVTRSLILASHTQIKIYFRFFRVDSWDTNQDDFLALYIDNNEKWRGYYHYDMGYNSICGKPEWKDLSLNVEVFTKHTTSNIDLKFQSAFHYDKDESYALRDIYIYINNRCDENYYYECCGDFKQQIGEECDDGNNIPFDGCHNCRYSCIEGCSNCIYGICLECQDGWILNEITQECKEDHQLNQQQLQCNENCSFCYLGICYQCNYGYSLQDNICYSICGDNLVNKDIVNGNQIEECDNPYSGGCQNCKILPSYDCISQDNSICWTCEEKCKECIKINNNLQCNKCQDGYYPNELNCYKCDPNCKTCLNYSYQCTSCYREDCLLCEFTEGLYTDEKLGKCVTICGDGIIVQGQEECDDGNQEQFDGCNNQCQIIPLFEDEEEKLFDIIKLEGKSKNDLNISKSSTIKLLCVDIVITIDGFDQSEFKYNLTDSYETCSIQFTFFKTIDSFNIILLYIPYSVQRVLYEDSKLITIKPDKQIYLSGDQQSQQEMISGTQSQFYLILLILAPVSIIFGVFDYFWAVLEILSWINNFYFLNVSFPFNVETIFLNGDWSSLVSFPTYTQFNQPDADYYFQSPQKFMAKGVDPLFINNAQVPFGFILFSVLLYTLSSLVLKFTTCLDRLLTKETIIKKQSRPIQFFKIKRRVIASNTSQTIDNNEMNQNEENKIIIHNETIVHLKKKVQNISIQLKGRINQTISLQIFDLTLAVILQIAMAYKFEYKIILINQVLALLSIFLIVYQLYQKYKLIYMHPILAENKEFSSKYHCLYEGINVQSQFGLVYNFIYMIRKVLYIFFTVFFYYNPLFQTSLCFVTCVLGVLLMLYQNPFESKKILIFQLIQEVSISSVVFITVLFAFDDESHCFGEDIKIIQGWVIISFISLALVTELLTLLYEIIKSSCQNVYKMYTYLAVEKKQKIKQNLEPEKKAFPSELNNLDTKNLYTEQKKQAKGEILQSENKKLKVLIIDGVLSFVSNQTN